MSKSAECPSCGAALSVGGQTLACPACGIPLLEPQPSSAEESRDQTAAIQSFAASANEQLAREGAEIADRAFNLGCGMSFFVIFLICTLVYFLGGRNWILVILAFILSTIALLWAVVLLTDVSRNRAIRRVFVEDIQPKINNFLRRHHIHISDFEAVVHRSLPEGSPLLLHVPPPPKTEPEISQEAL